MRSRRPAITLLFIATALPGLTGTTIGASDASRTNPILTAIAPAADLSLPHAEDTVLVGFVPGATATTRANARATVGATARPLSPLATDVEQWRLPASVSVAAAIAALGRNPAVAYAEPDYVVHHEATSNDPYVTNGTLWGMYGPSTGAGTSNQYGSNAAAAWAAGATGSSSVYVGVIDEGFQYAHRDLSTNSWTNAADPVNGRDDDGNGYIDDVHGWDFYYGDASVYDAGGDNHGTHVSGTIGGAGGNGIGVAGVNWTVRIISGKFLGPNGGYTSDAIRAVDYMTWLKTRGGLNIVATNNSWGGGGYTQSLRDAIRRGGDAGILFIAAAGNAALNIDSSVSYPAAYDCSATAAGAARGWDCVIAVAAITSSGGLASYSNYGVRNVDLGAPGSNITSTLPDSSYGAYSGTSMATPHVSGAAALCESINPSLTAGQIRSTIMATAVATSSLANRTVTGGRLDVGAMAASCASGGSSYTAPAPITTLGAFSKTSPGNNASGVAKQATLSWGASANAARYDVCLTTASTCTSWSSFSSSTTAVRANLRGATTYRWQVRAVGADGSTVDANAGTLWTFRTQ